MKKNRQEAIIELIQKYPIETQEELLSRLNQIGFKTTQATISRDIRELALIKKPDADGKQIYCLIDQEDETSRKYQRILAEAIVSMELAENMLVVKTVSGMAMASAAALDSLNIIGIFKCSSNVISISSINARFLTCKFCSIDFLSVFLFF